MASIHKKIVAMSRDLADRLTVRLNGTLALVQSFDTNGNPTIAIGAGSAGGQNAFIRLIESPSLGVNAVGNSQDSYGPNICQVALETSSVANVPLLTIANDVLLMGELFGLKTRLEVYLSSNGTAPVLGSITGTPAATYESLYFAPMKNM